jgi:hypothetical protein
MMGRIIYKGCGVSHNYLWVTIGIRKILATDWGPGGNSLSFAWNRGPPSLSGSSESAPSNPL